MPPTPFFTNPWLAKTPLWHGLTSGSHVIGIGVDLIDLRRFSALWDRRGQALLDRLFTANEQILGGQTKTPQATAFYGKRFAAKEACAKALGCGIGQFVGWQDICVLRTTQGAPQINLSHSALARLGLSKDGLTPPLIWVSLTDEPPYGLAFVVITRAPCIQDPT